MDSKIYVANFSYDTTEVDLRSLFAQAGTVNEVVIIKDRDTGSSKGFAFITMNSQEEANKAIAQFNGRNLGSRELTVNMARPREDSQRSYSDSNQSGGYKSNYQNRGGARRY